MEYIDLEIQNKQLEHDFTVNYEGREYHGDHFVEKIVQIKTSKEAFFTKLEYFKGKANEYHNEISINDKYPIQIFQDFINSLTSYHIKINKNNYPVLAELCSKYQYQELKEEIEKISQIDLQDIVSNYQFDEPNFSKDEIIAENLDICLQNEQMVNYPIPVLCKILNSPKRIINDHHLLFTFVQKVINKKEEENYENKEDYALLLNSLDFLKMSDDDLDAYFKNEKFLNIFEGHSRQIMERTHKYKKEKEEKARKNENKVNFLYFFIISFFIVFFVTVFYFNSQITSLQKMEYEKRNTKQNHLTNQNENKSQIDNEQIEIINKKLRRIENEIDFVLIFVPIPDKPRLSGIFDYLRKKSNGAIEKEINITASSCLNEKLYPPKNALSFDNGSNRFCSKNISNSWITFELKNYYVVPAYYAIRTFLGAENAGHMKNWVVEGSDDGIKWNLIDEQVNNQNLKNDYDHYIFYIQMIANIKIRYIRVRSIGPDWNNSNFLSFNLFEIYGYLYPVSKDD